jgi:hypothetical protein
VQIKNPIAREIGKFAKQQKLPVYLDIDDDGDHATATTLLLNNAFSLNPFSSELENVLTEICQINE